MGSAASSARRELVVGHARRAQGRRRLRAARPDLPGRAARVHAGGRRALPVLLTPGAAGCERLPAGRCTRGPLDETAESPGRRGGGAGVPVGPADEPRLRHLHLGLDRPAQGGDGRAPRRWSTSALACIAGVCPRAAAIASRGALLAGVRLSVASSRGALLVRRRGSMLVAERRTLRGPRRRRCSRRTAIALVKLTPTHPRAARRSSWPARLSGGLRCAGDRRRGAAARACDVALARAGDGRLINEYGPTEATVDCAARDGSTTSAGGERVPSGGRSPTPRLYVLDRRPSSRVPVGVPGELLHRRRRAGARLPGNGPELTAERFVADPFAREPAARLYRTGDLARCLAGRRARVPRPRSTTR